MALTIASTHGAYPRRDGQAELAWVAVWVIAQAHVESQSSRINVRKAPGPDGIPNWVPYDFCTYLSRPVCVCVCVIFNASIRDGFCIAARWIEAKSQPAEVH